MIKINPIKIVDLGLNIYDSDTDNRLCSIKSDVINIEGEEFNFFNKYISGYGTCTVFYKTTKSRYYTEWFGLVKYIYNEPIEEFWVDIIINNPDNNIKVVTNIVKTAYLSYKSKKTRNDIRIEQLKNKQFIL